ncbi:MAG TPA: tetratricopeptide repeat protein [Usitatibacter sp.]|nr:tetratricopeptide repeat protein [Usitatibacter sp.]
MSSPGAASPIGSAEDEARAFALLAADRIAEAEEAWRRILERDPASARASHFLGCVLARGGRLEEGLVLLDRSLEREPRNAMFLANRARVLDDAGRLEAAVEDLRRAVRADARFAAAYHHLGLALGRLGRAEEALAALRRAAALDPASPGVNAGLGRALYEAGDAAGARAAFERALAAHPRDADLLNNLGLALARLGLHAEAVDRYRAALESRPDFPEARLHWANALRDSGDFAAAVSRYESVLRDRPDFAPALLACASAALDSGDLARARALYERALAAAPGSADARYGLGQVALREHRFADGWAGYERRFETDPPQSRRRASRLPSLDMSDIERVRKVAVWGEQGLGDQLLFSTLLPELAARGIPIALDVDPRLTPLLVRALRGAGVAASGGDRDAGCDAQLALGSLGALFRPDAASFARQPRALLSPDPVRAAQAAAGLAPGRRKIGISWRSLRDRGQSALALRKSAPLEAFAALAVGDTRLVDLQYGEFAQERERFSRSHPGALLKPAGLDPVADLEGLLAVIATCDVVVTTSNVTAHLAGAIGKETLLVYLAANAPFFYWVPGADGRTLWYPSVRVVRAPELDTWEKALERAAAMLE